LARAEIEARGGAIQTASKGSDFGFLGFLFGGARGGGADDEEESGPNSVVVSGFSGRSGRGGSQVASASAPSSAAPDALTSARGNLPRGQTYAQATPAAPPVQAPTPVQPTPTVAPPPVTQVVATDDADATPDPGEVSLHGPIAAKFIAPLPPRKPAGLVDIADVVPVTPLPPTRPVEFVVAAEESKPANLKPSSNGDLIAALLERGKLPRAITHGVGTTPSNALALADPGAPPEPPERPSLLARAAALTAPLPPARPVPRASARPSAQNVAGETSVARNSAASASADRARKETPGHGASLENPYGELILDAFNTQRPATGAGDNGLFAGGLRGSAQ
jgi:hypothetical protein